MKRILLFAFLFLFAAGPVLADVIRPMQSSPSAGELQKACGAAGGTFGTDAEVGLGSGYGCTKKNCDGKGGTCAVSCDNGKCWGSTPTRIGPTTIIGILQNGDRIIHQHGQAVGAVPGSMSDSVSLCRNAGHLLTGRP